MELESFRVISNGTIEKAFVSKEADFGARGNTFMNVVNVDEEEGRTQDSVLGSPERTGQCTVNRDPLDSTL